MSNMRISFTNPEGETMVVHPEAEATHGVYIASEQLKGDIVDAPVKTEWDSTAMQEGGTQRGVDYEYRDLNIGFHVTDNAGISAEEADSTLRNFFEYEEDEWDPNPITQTRIDFETEISDTRSLNLLLASTPETVLTRDPIMQQYFNPLYTLRAGQPMWYEMVGGKPYKVTAFDFGAGDTDGFIEVENRTDRAARHSWVVAGGIGMKTWLPDITWAGAKGAREPGGTSPDRMLQLPTIASPHMGGFRVTLNRGTLMVKDMGNTNVLGQMPVPGSYFMNRIPMYTRKQLLPVSVKDVPVGGGRIELRMPLLWSRPYGLERW